MLKARRQVAAHVRDPPQRVVRPRVGTVGLEHAPEALPGLVEFAPADQGLGQHERRGTHPPAEVRGPAQAREPRVRVRDEQHNAPLVGPARVFRVQLLCLCEARVRFGAVIVGAQEQAQFPPRPRPSFGRLLDLAPRAPSIARAIGGSTPWRSIAGTAGGTGRHQTRRNPPATRTIARAAPADQVVAQPPGALLQGVGGKSARRGNSRRGPPCRGFARALLEDHQLVRRGTEKVSSVPSGH